ncbi:MAG: ribonucleoside-diphosphate reductase subunit alpha [Parachlamydiales bacterium]
MSKSPQAEVLSPKVAQKGPRAALAVLKRGGMLVPFRRERIAVALEAAFRDTRRIAAAEAMANELVAAVERITHLVTEECLERGQRGARLTVEGIQDLVEVKLMEAGYHDVARDYILYRDSHKALREDSPRNLRITRRDGQLVRFNPMKIASAIEKAFVAHKEEITDTDVAGINLLTERVVGRAMELAKAGVELGIETIQDEVENALMDGGYHEVARGYILYRARHADERKHQVEPQEEAQQHGRSFKIVKGDGSEGKVSERELKRRVTFACKGLEGASAEELLEASILSFYDGMKEGEVDLALIMGARTRIEKEPAYSQVAARLLLDSIYREILGAPATDKGIKGIHHTYFKEYLKLGIKEERVDKRLLSFDTDKLAEAMELSRDLDFTYLGLQTLYDRYFIHVEEKRIETPQIFWMRVAMGLALNEGREKNQRAIEFYNVLSRFHYVSATPTLFNSGTTHPQLSSCYLLTVMDDLHHIFKTFADNAQLSKWAGGIGDDWTNVRATGARIKGTNGKSQGIVPFLKIANDTAVAVNQGGKRKGAMCAYLETWHLDIEEFLELRKNTGDERRRTHDMNTANWIPDLFLKRVAAGGSWTLFSPSDVPDLHDLYGRAFEKRYFEYEKRAEEGKLPLHKKVEALALWRKMLSMLFETGHPWITFKDPSNIRSPQDHVGVVHSSNLCTEILLNTSREETAVCNLGSVNLAKHVGPKGLDKKRLAETVATAMRMLDNVIDINYYPTQEAKNANLRHRPVGLGVMAFQDALYLQNISYASHEAVEFADEVSELIAYHAILASSELAKERGTYESYKGSKWDRGLLPLDTLKCLEEERGAEWVELDTRARLDWAPVREAVKRQGMRNSNCMAIAPTATIANIAGVTQSIEPAYKQLFVKSNLSGEFTVPNPYLVDRLKALGMWDADMIDDLKYFDGSLQEIERIPDEIKEVFLTAFEIEPEWLIECAARRQKWIDMGQSLNLYLAEPSGKKLHTMYMLSWKKGLKTNYYLRTTGATQIEKSTTDINKRGLQPRWMKSVSASSRIQVQREKPVACSLDGDCEACQ